MPGKGSPCPLAHRCKHKPHNALHAMYLHLYQSTVSMKDSNGQQVYSAPATVQDGGDSRYGGVNSFLALQVFSRFVQIIVASMAMPRRTRRRALPVQRRSKHPFHVCWLVITRLAAPPVVLPASQRSILGRLQVMREQPPAPLLCLILRLSATSRTQQSRRVARHRASL